MQSLVKNVPVTIAAKIEGVVKFRIGVYLNRYFKEDKINPMELFIYKSKPDLYKDILIWSDELSMKL